MKKTIFALVLTLTMLLSACGNDPREESPTLNVLMEHKEEINANVKEGERQHNLTNNTEEMEDGMIKDYKILEEEYGDEFFVYISILGGHPLEWEESYHAILVAKPESKTAELFKQHLDGEENPSDWAILKQNLTESAYDVLYKGIEEDKDKIEIFFYDPFLYDPPVLITFPNIHNEVVEYY